MTLLELVRRTRVLLDDLGGDFDAPWGMDDSLCDTSNRDLVAYLDEARTLYRERFPIRDGSSLLTSITVEDDDAGLVTLDPCILDVRQVRMASSGQALEPATVQQLDRAWPTWRDGVGEPIYWIVNHEEQALQLAPAPDVDTPLRLVVDRLPETPLDWDDRAEEVPDVPSEHQDLLAYKAAATALQRPGQMADDVRIGQQYEARFVRLVGHPITPQERAVRRMSAARVLRVRTTAY